ncbi:MAG TPA: hypothetical protein DEP35_06010 [Deltaproteobacteria bacterium]|jgi:hypothetical protein|nr:hypothetical protein [Deltaproteobacteria bacterium]
MATHAELEHLVTLGRDLEVALSDRTLAEVADLVLRLHQDHARRAGAILPSAMQRAYYERGEMERDGMRSAVKHVLMALVLLDIIELPAHAPG